MKEMQIFENQEFGTVRTVELTGSPGWWARMWPRRWGTAIRVRHWPTM